MENFLLFFFSLLLGIVTFFPFYVVQENLVIQKNTKNEDLLELESLRNIEFENLQDLKIDLELKKITENEFYELSMPIIQELEKIDKSLLSFNHQLEKNSEKKINFCYSCGFKIEQEKPKSCSNCNTSFQTMLSL